LKSPFPRLVAMNPVTAVAFISSGISFLLLSARKNKQQEINNWYVFATLVLLTGVAKITMLVINSTWQIDQVLFPKELKKEISGNLPNHMAPNTAFCFILSG